MSSLFDAMADAHFVPQKDGTVRFVLPKPDLGYLILDEEEANGAKIFWRPMFRYFIHACHAFALLGLFVPWLGLLLLATLWLVSIVFLQEVKYRFKRKVGKEKGQHDWVCYQLSRSVSRPRALWLRSFAIVAGISSVLAIYLFPPEVTSAEGTLMLFGLMTVTTRWCAYLARFT